MVQITEEEYSQFKALKTVWKHLNAQKTSTYFICGDDECYDSFGVPDHIVICPLAGLDHTILYKKVST